MTFKKFITESKHYTEISDDEYHSIIDSNVVNPDKFDIYRGSYYWDDDTTYLIDTSNTTRRSAHTYNYYTIVMDKILAERNLPLRSKSIICSNSKNVASNFGSLKRIIPFDEAMIGIVPAEDIWYINLNANDEVTFEYFACCLASYNVSEKSYDDIIKDVAEIINKGYDNKKIYEDGNEDDFKSLFGGIDGSANEVNKRLYELFDLDKLGFKFATGKDYKKITGENEIWISGKSIAIDV